MSRLRAHELLDSVPTPNWSSQAAQSANEPGSRPPADGDAQQIARRHHESLGSDPAASAHPERQNPAPDSATDRLLIGPDDTCHREKWPTRLEVLVLVFQHVATCAALIGREWAPLAAAEMAHFEMVPTPTRPGDVLFFDSFVPHASNPNFSREQRRILYLTYNRASDGDHRIRYFAYKRASFPPDIERLPNVEYRFRV
jgi:hypothetical protein